MIWSCSLEKAEPHIIMRHDNTPTAHRSPWRRYIQRNPCWVFSFHPSISLICKHDSNWWPRNKTTRRLAPLMNLLLILFNYCSLFHPPEMPQWSACLWFQILLLPVTSCCRSISYLQRYWDRSIPGQAWQVSSWQGWMEHLICNCCTVEAALSSCSHLSVSMLGLLRKQVLFYTLASCWISLKSHFFCSLLQSCDLWPLSLNLTKIGHGTFHIMF